MFLQKTQNKIALDKSRAEAILAEWGGNTYTVFNKLVIKGSKFALKIGEETKTLMKGKTPIQELNVIFCRTRPGTSRAYYNGDFEEGMALRPDCYSRDGLTPDADVEAPQCDDCRTCPLAVIGSAKTGKGAACRQHRTMVLMIVKPDGSDVMRDGDGEPLFFQLDVPLMSLTSRASKHGTSGFNEYVKYLLSCGLEPHQVVTELTFNPDVNYPMLSFDHAMNLDDDGLAAVEAVRQHPDVEELVGVQVAARTLTASKPKAALPPAESKPAAKGKGKVAAPTLDEDDLDEDDLSAQFDNAATLTVAEAQGDLSLDDLDFDE